MSFQKPRSQQIKIPGTTTSLHNGQSLASTGNPSLDHIFGGGVVVGSILLIEEDKFTSYSKVLSKYFLAEGFVHNHALCIATLDDDPNDFIKKVPLPVVHTAPKKDNIGSSDDDMRIAFRYNDLPKVNSVQTLSNIGHYFDLTKQIEISTIESQDISYWGEENSHCVRKQQIFHNPKYLSLLDMIRAKTKQACFSLPSDGKEKNILRICINSLGSPLWYDSNFSEDICKFLIFLKSIVRQSQTVCCITIPAHLFNHLDTPGLLQRIRHCVDYSIHLEAFAGSDRETNPYFKEYNGLLNIRKLTAFNTFAPFTPETHDLAFKLRRKKFVIEKLHLPPEMQESDQREQDEVQVNCGSMSKSKLDF